MNRRIWAMPNSETFKMKPIRELISHYMGLDNYKIWVDPFVRNSIFKDQCKFTNDLNPSIKATHNMDALDFLHTIDTSTVDGVLFDPPYSSRQIKECYNSIGLEVGKNSQSSFYSKKKDEIARILRPNGICISFGWNSNGLGKTRGFDIVETLLVPHGAAHNDTIVTVERKLCLAEIQFQGVAIIPSNVDSQMSL